MKTYFEACHDALLGTDGDLNWRLEPGILGGTDLVSVDKSHRYCQVPEKVAAAFRERVALCTALRRGFEAARAEKRAIAREKYLERLGRQQAVAC